MEGRSSMSCMDNIMRKAIQYTVKKRLAILPSLAWMSLIKLSPGQNNLIIPGQGEFGK
jgi:hypothetical protein